MGFPLVLLSAILFFAFLFAIVVGGFFAWFRSKELTRKTDEIRDDNERTYLQKRDDLQQK